MLSHSPSSTGYAASARAAEPMEVGGKKVDMASALEKLMLLQEKQRSLNSYVGTTAITTWQKFGEGKEQAIFVAGPKSMTLSQAKTQRSEFGVRKNSLIKKSPTQKMGTLMAPQTYLKKEQSLDFFYVKGRGNWRGCFCKNSSPQQNSSNDQLVCM